MLSNLIILSDLLHHLVHHFHIKLHHFMIQYTTLPFFLILQNTSKYKGLRSYINLWKSIVRKSINSCLYCSILSISSCYPKPSFVFVLFYSTIKKGEPQCVPEAFGLPVGVKILADSIIMCPHSNYFHGSIIPHPIPFHWLTIHLINQPVLNIDSSRINSLQISNQSFIGWWILKRVFPDDLYQLFHLIIKSGTLQILNIFYCLLIIYNSVHRSTILHLPLAHNLLTAYPSRFL